MIGAAHAGWRGALTGVIEATVAAMEKLGAERARIVAAAGPMIRQPNYEVGQDLVDRFVGGRAATRVRFFKPAPRAGHAMFDLAGYVGRALRPAPRSRRSRTSGFAPMPIRRSSLPTAAPPTGPSRITADISTRSRWPINVGGLQRTICHNAARRMDRRPNAVTNSLRNSPLDHRKAAARGGALMQWRGVRRVWGAPRRSVSSVGVLAVAALAASAAGCSSLPSDGRASLASAARPARPSRLNRSTARRRTCSASWSPISTTRRGARQIAVVSRDGAATYRVRGYVSAQVERGKTTFAWVWDVYDADKRRALRMPARSRPPPAAGRDAWAAADEQVLRRIARDSMERLAAFLNASEPRRPRAEPSLATLASAATMPGGAGIFRVFSAGISRPTAPPRAQPQPKRAEPAKAAAPRSTRRRALADDDVGRSPVPEKASGQRNRLYCQAPRPAWYHHCRA